MRRWLLVVMAACAAPGPAGPVGPAVAFDDDEMARILQHSPLPPPPKDPTNAVSGDPDAARLGRLLFYDTRLSREGTVSCSTCHLPDEAFTDGGRVLARGRQELPRHAPALWNVAYNRWFFWDGRVDSLWAQALKPLEDEREHGTTREDVVALVRSDPPLRAAYERVFGSPDGDVTAAYVNLGKSIAAFVEQIVSDRSPFDVFVEGLREDDPDKLAALSPSAQRGLKMFMGRGNCHLCHSGPNFTDMEFHSIRIPPLNEELSKDPGRYAGIEMVLQDEFNGVSPWSDDPDAARVKLAYLQPRPGNRGEFKTPTLRNVALTAPYMHQGQAATLDDVLLHYSEFPVIFDPVRNHFEQTLVPLRLTAQETTDMIAFLESLTDADVDPDMIAP